MTVQYFEGGTSAGRPVLEPEEVSTSQDVYRPQRARDTTEEELKELLKKSSLLVSIKHDGVRGLGYRGLWFGKSMTPHRNKTFNSWFQGGYMGSPLVIRIDGLDAEILLLDEDMTYDKRNIVQKTAAFLNSEDTPDVNPERVVIRVFDNFKHEHLTLTQRLGIAEQIVDSETTFMKSMDHFDAGTPGVQVVKRPQIVMNGQVLCSTIEEIIELRKKALMDGYEGLVIRRPDLPVKQGRSSAEGEFLRLKLFQTEEATVEGYELASKNNNPSVKDALGLAKRSSHKHAKVPKDEIGSFICFANYDIRDLFTDELLIKAGQRFSVSATSLPLDQRKYLFTIRETLKDQVLKFKFFPKGIKDKPRFTTFVCWMSKADYSPLP